MLRAPFPWFGGKSTVAGEVWRRLGNVPNYVEPFFGSGAVLLARPGGAGHTETVNDLDGFVSNFWRAVKHDPATVVRWIDYPVIERDLEARHYWLVTEGRARVEAVRGDPDGFDAQVAGWWCWGLCCWIGSGWCAGEGPWVWDGTAWINRKLPHLGDAGCGINRKLPHLGDAGRGINRKRMELANDGEGVHRLTGGAAELVFALSKRLERVRVCSGDWSRVCGPSVTFKHNVTGMFLDPPYSGAERQEHLYATDCGDVARKAAAWAREAARNPLMRIAFCGYSREHDFPGWTEWGWAARGGYGSQSEVGRGRANAERETIWFSPSCLVAQRSLFDAAGGAA